jgi:myo-inositol-1(or 4)-monophosphatase
MDRVANQGYKIEISNESKNQELVSFIEGIVMEAGKQLREFVKQPLDIKLKNDDLSDLVTKFDIQIERYLVGSIARKYPEHTFITEEKTCENQCFTEFTWIIDPIDGTTNFVSIGKDFAISIALYIHKEPYLGIVYDVMKDEMYTAVTNQGAYINGKRMDKKTPEIRLKDSLIDISLNSISIFQQDRKLHIPYLTKEIRGHRCYGAASLSICKIARGELQAYISAKLCLWDYAAAIILLKEVGGAYQYFDYEGIDPFPVEKVMFIASENRVLQREITEKLYALKT